MSGSSFLQPKEFYKRDINPLGQYVQQMAFGLSKARNIPLEEARTFVLNKIKNKQFPKIKDPVVEFFGRDHNLDRTNEELTLSQYFKEVVKNREILVPTFTTYCSMEEDTSPLSSFSGDNVAKRSVLKKASQKAYADGDFEVAFEKNIAQANKKENNNSLSGAFATDSSVFENDTGHNTLTSITRSMASIGNALNERMIGGNRHYRSISIVYNNILAIISSMDITAVHKAVEKFNLHVPSTEEVLEVLKHSMKFYIFDKKIYIDLKNFIDRLNNYEKVAIIYNQDFYHLRKFNESFVRKLLENFCFVDRAHNFEDPVANVKSRDGLTVNYGHQVLIEEVKGFGHNYDKMPLDTQHAIANVCANIDKQVAYYKPLIDAFFLTKTVPNSTAYIQDMIRKDVVLSDTDSTMFSIDEWVEWYFGNLNFSQKAFGIAGAVMFMSTQCIAHCLAILSGNMGVSDKHLFTLSMKPEYVFPVFVQSPVAKHYFTAKLVEEGKVFNDIIMEIKGVHNKNSALPVNIITEAHNLMEQLIRDIMAGKKISINENITAVAKLEREIISSLKNSEMNYLKRSNINDASAYKKGPKESNYAFHTLWESSFAAFYGEISPPPYDVVKIPTTLTTPTAFKNWLAKMNNRNLASKIEAWALEHNKKKITTFYFSVDKVTSSGLPLEVFEVIDYRRIVLDMTNVRRMLLESLGFTVRDGYLLSELGY